MQAHKRQERLGAQALFEYAVKSLGVRAQSSEELRTKLRRRASLASDVDSTITRLKEIGYLDDARFAQSYANARLENEGFGKTRVLNDLRQRRVTGNMADAAVQQTFEGKEEDALVDAFIQRRMPRVARGEKLKEQKDLAAAYRKLLRAGFSSGVALRALKKCALQPEVIDDIALEDAPEEESF